MNEIPQKNSLVSQVATILEKKIVQGEWQEWLPNERALCQSLYVSRNTLRAALAQLKERKVLESVHPLGTRILIRNPAPKNQPTQTIGLLSPVPAEAMRPNVTLILDELRGHLAEAGYRLRLHHGEQYFHGGSDVALRKLTKNFPHDCWVLVLADARVKRWFKNAGIATVVSGSCDPDAALPFVDLDYRALCRHAVGQMTAAGHRRLVFFVQRSTLAGDRDSELGFKEGVESARHAGVESRIVHHQGTPASALRALNTLFSSTKPPSALLISNPYYYLLALTYLQQRGLRVPADVSLVSRDDDSFLQFIQPVPSCYSFDAHTFSKRLFKLIMQIVSGQAAGAKGVQIMPDYRKGMTLAKPRRTGEGD